MAYGDNDRMLSEYANSEIDVLKTMTMLLIHDIVEIDAAIHMPMMRKLRKLRQSVK